MGLNDVLAKYFEDFVVNIRSDSNGSGGEITYRGSKEPFFPKPQPGGVNGPKEQSSRSVIKLLGKYTKPP